MLVLEPTEAERLAALVRDINAEKSPFLDWRCDEP
jgi:hypothetical protein